MDKYKVVIVDDDEVSLENLSFELRKDARFSLEGTARNGRKGKKLITKVQPDLLFLDVEMPDMTGLDLGEQADCILSLCDCMNYLTEEGQLVFLLVIYLVTVGRGIGGGDIKLMFGAGLLLGWKGAILAFFLGCIIGSVIHLIRMAVSHAEHRLAMGPYLSVGIWLTALWGTPVIDWYVGVITHH